MQQVQRYTAVDWLSRVMQLRTLEQTFTCRRMRMLLEAVKQCCAVRAGLQDVWR